MGRGHDSTRAASRRWPDSTPRLFRALRSAHPTLPRDGGGKFHYILYFQEPGVAEAELEADVPRTLRGFYQDIPGGSVRWPTKSCPGVMGPAGGGILDRLPDRPHGNFMTDADFDVFVNAFERSGFRGPLNWYRNFDRNWEESADLGYKVYQPALMICAEKDPVLPPWMAAGMKNSVPNLTRNHHHQGLRPLDPAGKARRSEPRADRVPARLKLRQGFPEKTEPRP